MDIAIIIAVILFLALTIGITVIYRSCHKRHREVMEMMKVQKKEEKP